MTEPFMPRHHHDDSIDAADGGLGSPGHEADRVDQAQLDEEVELFEERLDADRDGKTLFRTPHPDSD